MKSHRHRVIATRAFRSEGGEGLSRARRQDPLFLRVSPLSYRTVGTVNLLSTPLGSYRAEVDERVSDDAGSDGDRV